VRRWIWSLAVLLSGHVVNRVDTSTNVVALTFDDGPTSHTPGVLRMLDDAGVRATGYHGSITFRPPYGKKLWTLPRYLSTHDRTMVTWDVEPDSATEAGADAIVAETVSRARSGSIILLHAMYDSRAASRAAVPRFIDELRSAGYRFVTVSELLTNR
jgi:peptidoglycan/xylan/chitin deacetylase (PgdA/CDA1 family)